MQIVRAFLNDREAFLDELFQATASLFEGETLLDSIVYTPGKIISAFSAQKSLVKSQNHLNQTNRTRSS
jgi:hypothetical protein